MGLETGDYISDLVPTNPTGTDPVSQGDDHIRLIKSVLQTQFPNLDAPVTATPDELNNPVTVPSGSIQMYGGAVAPTGWLLCDGSEVDRTTYADLWGAIGDTWGDGNGTTTFNLPDIRDKVAAGAGTSALATTAGADSHTITASQMPTHTHDMKITFYNNNANLGTTTPGSDDVPQSYKTPTEDSGAAGGSNPMDMRQATVYVNYIIKE
jgi:microcystin-dependent protein